MPGNESRWQQRTNLLPVDRTAEFNKFPQLSIRDLMARTQRPRRCKMLMRDFVDGMASLVLPIEGTWAAAAFLGS